MSFASDILVEVKQLHDAIQQDDRVITEQDLQSFPTIMQQWVKKIGLIGIPRIQKAYFKQEGLIRLKPNQKKWTPATAEQWVTTNPPAFLWKVRMFPVIGRDLYTNGKGQMKIKLASLIPVVNTSDNEKLNESTLQRFLLELPWYPTAVLSPYLHWEDRGDGQVKVTMDYLNVNGTATYHFSDQGDLLQVRAFRYKEADAQAQRLECIGVLKKQQEFAGICIPSEVDITWKLPEGDFTWYQVKVIEAQFS